MVLGGGVGGIAAARRLRQRLPASDRIVLVDRETSHLFQPSLLWLMTGQRTPRQIVRPLASLARRNIEVVHGEVTALDPDQRRVRVGDRELSGDAVIIALGAELHPEAIPGLAEGGLNLYSLDGASAIRDALARFRGGRVVLLTAAPVYKCPAAPYEAAMLVEDFLRRRRTSTQVELYAAEPGPMATAGPEVSRAVRGMVEGHGVGYHPAHQLGSVDAAHRLLRFTNGLTVDYDLLLYVPPHRAPSVLEQAGLLASTGWVSVDRSTLATEANGVFAIGDATSIPIPSGKFLPKAGVFAHRQGEVVAENLADRWTGRSPRHTFDGVGACFIETGGGQAGYGSGNFYAEPAPHMRLRPPSRWWHWGKVLVEKRWLHRSF
jgi:sulfide:quinone oxidoreductase